MGINKNYELKTLKEIAEVVNEENFDTFIKDFKSWLAIHISIKKTQSMFPNVIKTDNSILKWTDDGIVEMTLKLKHRED